MPQMVLKMQEAFDIDESNKYAEELITENHEFQTQINDWLMCRGETGKSSVVFFWDDRDTDEKGEKQPPGNPHGKTSFGTRHCVLVYVCVSLEFALFAFV
jgi:hypothetical protein